MILIFTYFSRFLRKSTKFFVFPLMKTAIPQAFFTPMDNLSVVRHLLRIAAQSRIFGVYFSKDRFVLYIGRYTEEDDTDTTSMSLQRV